MATLAHIPPIVVQGGPISFGAFMKPVSFTYEQPIQFLPWQAPGELTLPATPLSIKQELSCAPPLELSRLATAYLLLCQWRGTNRPLRYNYDQLEETRLRRHLCAW